LRKYNIPDHDPIILSRYPVIELLWEKLADIGQPPRLVHVPLRIFLGLLARKGSITKTITSPTHPSIKQLS
jgi:hypothetical protein